MINKDQQLDKIRFDNLKERILEDIKLLEERAGIRPTFLYVGFSEFLLIFNQQVGPPTRPPIFMGLHLIQVRQQTHYGLGYSANDLVD